MKHVSANMVFCQSGSATSNLLHPLLMPSDSHIKGIRATWTLQFFDASIPFYAGISLWRFHAMSFAAAHAGRYKMKLQSVRKFWCFLCFIVSVLALVNFGFTSVANAHVGLGINGGQLFDTGTNHVELVGASGYEILMVVITDKMQKPISIAGIDAYISVERAGQKFRIPLANSGGNILSSRQNPNLVAGEIVHFIAKMPGGIMLNAQFTSK